jgi:hypothetical protein
MITYFASLLLFLSVSLVLSEEQLFAVIGGTYCAETLYYGPQQITLSGSADGNYPYFLSTATASKDIPHDEWLQVVTSDGSTELFRVYWKFATSKTLAQRFISATTFGDAVTYRIVDSGTNQELTYSAIWWFSSTAAITAAKFQTATTTCCFSADDGAWGAGTGVINADGNAAGYAATSFWGPRRSSLPVPRPGRRPNQAATANPSFSQ